MKRQLAGSHRHEVRPGIGGVKVGQLTNAFVDGQERQSAVGHGGAGVIANLNAYGERFVGARHCRGRHHGHRQPPIGRLHTQGCEAGGPVGAPDGLGCGGSHHAHSDLCIRCQILRDFPLQFGGVPR